MNSINETLKFDYNVGKFYVDDKSYIESGSEMIGRGTYSCDREKAVITINAVKWKTSAEIALDLTNDMEEAYVLTLHVLNDCDFRSFSSTSNAIAVDYNGKQMTVSTSTYGQLYAGTRSDDDRTIEKTYGIRCNGRLNINDANIQIKAEFGWENYGIFASKDMNIYGGKVNCYVYGWPASGEGLKSYALCCTGERICIDFAEVEAIGRTAAVQGNLYLGSSRTDSYRWWSLEGFDSPWSESEVNHGAVQGENLKPGDFKEGGNKTYLKFLPERPQAADVWNSQDDSLYLYHKHTIGDGVPMFIMPVHVAKEDLKKDGKYQKASEWAADLIVNAETFEGLSQYLDIYIYLRGDLISPVPQIGYVGSFSACLDKMRSLVSQILGDAAVPKARMIYLGNCDNAGQVGGHAYGGVGAMLSWGKNPESKQPWEPNPEYWVLHEFSGHGFACLADEYRLTPYWDPKPHEEAPNLYISPQKPDAKEVPWKDFIGFKDRDQEPTGIYGYDGYNAWRPCANCFMNSNPNFYVPMYHKWVIYKNIMEYAGTPKTLEDFCKFKKISLTPFHIAYSAHVKSYGWLNYVSDGQTAGTTGESRRLEAVKIRLEDCSISEAGVRYRVHVQAKGWLPYVQDDQIAGTTGESRRAEAIQIELVNLPDYTVEYRVHMKDKGWSAWVRDGAIAGTTGESRRIEAVQVQISKK